MAGLDPAIHQSNGRIELILDDPLKPGHDAGGE